MNTAGKSIVWTCICSTLLMGCHYSAIISPPGDEKGKMDPNKIEYIVTKDGTEHRFNIPPTIINDAFVGTEKKRTPVSIPLVSVSRTYAEGKCQFVVTNDSTKYKFDTPLTMSNGSFVGDTTNRLVSIPLSDVSEISITKFNTVGTVLLGVAVTALVVAGIYVAGLADALSHKWK